MRKKSLTEKTLSLLLSGQSRAAKRFAGEHVLVVRDKVIPLRTRRADIWKDIADLQKKYGEMPVVTFVPRLELLYILARC